MSSLCLLNQFFVRLGKHVEEIIDTVLNIYYHENNLILNYLTIIY